MSEYKISELAKALGLSPETLRHYERSGIIQPRRDEQTGYRYFSSRAFSDLLIGKWMRSMDFSLDNIKSLLNDVNTKEYDAICAQKELELLKIIGEYQTKFDAVHELRRRLRDLEKRVGVFEVAKTKQMVFHPCKNSKDVFLDAETVETNVRWLELMPDARFSFMLPVSPYESEVNFKDYFLGYSLPYKQALQHPKLFGQRTIVLPSAIALHTVFYITANGTTLDSMEEQIFSKIREMDCRICGAPYGHQIVRTQANDGPRLFLEVWVPVEGLSEDEC